MTARKCVTSDDIWIEVPLRVMVWHEIMASCSLVPSDINCVLSVFSLRQFDVIYRFISSVHVIKRDIDEEHDSFVMTTKLRIVRISVCTETMSLSNVSDIGSVV